MSNLLKRLLAAIEKKEAAAPAPAPLQPEVVGSPPVAARPRVEAVPAAPAPVPATPEPVVVNHAGEGPVDERGIPVFPWPIIVTRATPEQLKSLSHDEEIRANLWGDNISDGWLGGNLMQNKFYRYKGRYGSTTELNADWRGTVWEEIWKAYVKLPVPEPKPLDPGWAKLDEAYKARAANGGADPSPAQPAAPTPAPQAGGDEDVPVGS